MINRRTVLAVTLTLVVALAAPAAAGSLGLSASPSGPDAAQSGTALTTSPQNNSTDNGSVSPGEQLAGVVSVQGAEVSGEVEERTFGLQIAAANSNSSKAAVVAEHSGTLQERLTEIQAQQETLQERYENGSISTGQYKARMAKLAAESRTVQRILNTTADTASELPEADLREKGVSVNSINSLRQNASNLTGPEVSAIAREIAGPNVGQTPPGLQNKTQVGPGNRGPGVGTPGNDNAGNGNAENVTNGGPGDVGIDSPGAPGNGGNNTTTMPGDGAPGNGSGDGRNVSVGNPGNGSNGAPGNNTPANSTPGNSSNPGTSTNPGTGIPADVYNVTISMLLAFDADPVAISS